MAATQAPGSLSAPAAHNPLMARPAWRPAEHAELPMNADGLRQAAEEEELQFPRGTATVEADTLDDVP